MPLRQIMVHVDSHYERMVRYAGGYNKFLTSCLNREANDDSYFVQLTLEHVDLPALPCRELIIRRTFNGRKEVESYWTALRMTWSMSSALSFSSGVHPAQSCPSFCDTERITSLAESRAQPSGVSTGNAYEKVLASSDTLRCKSNSVPCRHPGRIGRC